MAHRPKRSSAPVHGSCIECFSSVSWLPSARTARCHRCHAITPLKDLAPLLNLARDAVMYGYLYPKASRKDKSAGVRKRYVLDPATILVWLGLAALGGIVAGLSHDLVKLAMRKILARKTRVPVFSRGKPDLSRKIITIRYEKEMTLILSEEELTVLMRSVRNYLISSRDIRRLSQEKRRAIDSIIELMERDREGQTIVEAGKREVRKELENWFKNYDEAPVLPSEITRRIGKGIKEN